MLRFEGNSPHAYGHRLGADMVAGGIWRTWTKAEIFTFCQFFQVSQRVSLMTDYIENSYNLLKINLIKNAYWSKLLIKRNCYGNWNFQ